jgi:hypothetical protein
MEEHMKPNPGPSGTHANPERGQILVLALLAVALGVTLIGGFLYYVSTSQRATGAIREVTVDQYSADSGAEDAIWRLLNQPGFKDSLAGGTPYSYAIGINGRTVAITVTKVLEP